MEINNYKLFCDLTEEQKNLLSEKTRDRNYGYILSCAIDNWKINNNIKKFDLGIKLNFEHKKFINYTDSGTCLVGSALVGCFCPPEWFFKKQILLACFYFKLSQFSINCLISGFDKEKTFPDRLHPAYKFAEEVSEIIFE